MRFNYDSLDGSVNAYGKCKITGEEYSVTYNLEGFQKWKQGMLIQEAMPEVSEEAREWLISGISPKGWKQLFPETNETTE